MKPTLTETALYAIGLAVGTAIVAAAVSKPKPLAIEAAPEPVAIEAPPEPAVVIHYPTGVQVPPGMRWPWCSESISIHTCWRRNGHSGRHCDFNLATGIVKAVWPSDHLAALCHEVS